MSEVRVNLNTGDIEALRHVATEFQERFRVSKPGQHQCACGCCFWAVRMTPDMVIGILRQLDEAERMIHDWTATDATIAIQEREELRLHRDALVLRVRDLEAAGRGLKPPPAVEASLRDAGLTPGPSPSGRGEKGEDPWQRN